MKMRFVCEDCNKEAASDKSKDTAQWKFYSPRCECGGKYTVKLK